MSEMVELKYGGRTVAIVFPSQLIAVDAERLIISSATGTFIVEGSLEDYGIGGQRSFTLIESQGIVLEAEGTSLLDRIHQIAKVVSETNPAERTSEATPDADIVLEDVNPDDIGEVDKSKIMDLVAEFRKRNGAIEPQE